MDFKTRLKELREEAKLTQKELAEKLNMTIGNVSKYETGRIEPSVETLQILSSTFECSVDYLLGESNIKKRANISRTGYRASNFCMRLKELRQAKGLTYQAFGEQIGVSANTISAWESGALSPVNDSVYRSISDFFEVTSDYLMGRTDDIYGMTPPDSFVAESNIEIKELDEIKELLRKGLVKKGKLKEGDPLPPSYVKKFFEKAMKFQEAADKLSDD